MTREEAIQVLNMVEAHGLADEAKRMAIEALSEVRCNDCKWNDDVIEVVRCKDCKWWNYGEDCVRHTEDTMGYTISTTAYDFCSYGERREK